MTTEPPAETVYLRDGNVLITSARANFGGTTYAIRHINSVEMGIRRAGRTWPLLMIIGGGGLFALSLVGWVTSRGADSGYCTGIGLFVAIGGVALYRAARDRYIVRITTSSGRVDALASTARADIERIVAAVTQAITGA